LPYFGTQHLDEIVSAKGFLGGASNFLIKTLAKVSWDLMVDIDHPAIYLKDEHLLKILSPSKNEKDFIHHILEVIFLLQSYCLE